MSWKINGFFVLAAQSNSQIIAPNYLSATTALCLLTAVSVLVAALLLSLLTAILQLPMQTAYGQDFVIFAFISTCLFLSQALAIAITRLGVGAREWLAYTILLIATSILFLLQLPNLFDSFAGIQAEFTPYFLRAFVNFAPLIVTALAGPTLFHSWLRRISFSDPSINQTIFLSALGVFGIGTLLFWFGMRPSLTTGQLVFVLVATILLFVTMAGCVGFWVSRSIPNQAGSRETGPESLFLPQRSVPGKYICFCIFLGAVFVLVQGSYLAWLALHPISADWRYLFLGLPILTGIMWAAMISPRSRPSFNWIALTSITSLIIIQPHDTRHWLINLCVWAGFICFSTRLWMIQFQYIGEKTSRYRDLLLYLSFGVLLGAVTVLLLLFYAPALLLWQKLYFVFGLLLLWPVRDQLTPLLQKLMLIGLFLAAILQFSTHNFVSASTLGYARLQPSFVKPFYKLQYEGQDYAFMAQEMVNIHLEYERNFRLDRHLKAPLHPMDEAMAKLAEKLRPNQVAFAGIGSQYSQCFFSPDTQIFHFQRESWNQKTLYPSSLFARLDSCEKEVQLVRQDLRTLDPALNAKKFDLIAIDIPGAEGPPHHYATIEAIRELTQMLSKDGVLIFETHSDLPGSMEAIAAAAAQTGMQTRIKNRNIRGERDTLTTQLLAISREDRQLQRLGFGQWRRVAQKNIKTWHDHHARYLPAF